MSKDFANLRRKLSADPAWAAYFRGADHCLAGDWDGALAIWADSLNAFIACGDETGIDQVATAIRDTLCAKGLVAMANEFGRLVDSWRHRMINDDLIWNWWRINNLPWQ